MKLTASELRAVQQDGFKISEPKRSEDDEQKAVIAWSQFIKWGDGKLADMIYHIPNGGLRSKREGAKFKALGVKAGVPDLHIFVPRMGFHSLYIEMKAKKGATSLPQREMIQRLRDCGHKVEVCYGFDHARRVISEYMGLRVEL